jgi:hypothetical protein
LAGKQNKTENGQGNPMTMKKLVIAIAVLGTNTDSRLFLDF